MTTKLKEGIWADGPFPLVPKKSVPIDAKNPNHMAYKASNMMADIHNCLLRGLNSIYNQAPYVTKPQDIQDLLLLVKLWCDEVTSHHTAEEVKLFPDIERLTGIEGFMEANIEQHHEFYPGLDALRAFAENRTVKTYNGKELQLIIEDFGEVLQRHLRDEIDTLMKLDAYSDEGLRNVLEEAHQHALKSADPSVQLPIIMRTWDNSFEGCEGGFFVPWFIFYLESWWYSRGKYSGAWRFLPCTTWGQRVPLPFARR